MSIKISQSLMIGRKDTGIFYDRRVGSMVLKVAGTIIATLTATGIALALDSSLAGGDLDLGSSGAAGTLDVFPATAAKGKLRISAADSDGDTLTSIINASQAAARVYTIPDAGTDASFVMTAGAQTLAGIKTFSSMPRIPRSAVVAAAGSVQGDAAALAEGFQTVSGANGTLGVVLPTAVAGAMVIIKGVTNGVLKVWPATGAAINGLGANNAMSLASGLIPAIFIADSTTQWYTIPLLPS